MHPMEVLALHSFHEAFGAKFGEWNGREIINHYGSPSGEYAAWQSATAIFDLSHRQVLRVFGTHRVAFLQGMLSQDIAGLSRGEQTYAALLTAKGGMVADVRILNRGDDLLLEVEAGLGPRVKGALEKYIISEDAELSDVSAQLGILAVAGPQSEGTLTRMLGEGAWLTASTATPVIFEGEPVWVLRDDILGEPARRLLIPRERLAAAAGRLLVAPTGALPRLAGMDLYEVVRVRRGVPRYGIDMDEQTIPLEAKLQRAISYNKGCYLGQEVIARATYRGHVNRLLCGLSLGEHLPEARAALLREGKPVGFITSAVRSPSGGGAIGLGYVQRDSAEAGTELEVAGNGRAVVSTLPVVPAPPSNLSGR